MILTHEIKKKPKSKKRGKLEIKREKKDMANKINWPDKKKENGHMKIFPHKHKKKQKRHTRQQNNKVSPYKQYIYIEESKEKFPNKQIIKRKREIK